MRFGIVSDPHLAPPETEPYVWHNWLAHPRSIELFDVALDWLREQQIDTLVLLGDLTENADWESFATVREQSLAFGVPVLAVPGNCDVDLDDRSLVTFEQITGEELTLAPAILHLDDRTSLELIGLTAEPGSKRLTGERTVADSTGARVLLTHYPILDFDTELANAGFKHSGNLNNRMEIETELRETDCPVVVIHGHLHIHDARISGSMLHLSCAALIEPPHHVNLVDITPSGGDVLVERWAHSVQSFEVDRLPVFSPEQDCWRWVAGAWGDCDSGSVARDRASAIRSGTGLHFSREEFSDNQATDLKHGCWVPPLSAGSRWRAETPSATTDCIKEREPTRTAS